MDSFDVRNAEATQPRSEIDFWQDLEQKGFLGPQTGWVYGHVFKWKVLILPSLVVASLSFYMSYSPDPVLAHPDLYGNGIARLIFCGMGIHYVFQLIQVILACKVFRSSIVTSVLQTVPDRSSFRNSRSLRINTTLFDSMCSLRVVSDVRLGLYVLGIVFRYFTSFLWLMPGPVVWSIYFATLYTELMITPATDFVMDLLLTLSHIVIDRFTVLIQDRARASEDITASLLAEDTFWLLAMREYNKMDKLLAELWKQGMSIFWMRFLSTILLVLTCIVGCVRMVVNEKCIVAALFAVLAFVYSIIFLLRLYKIARITSRCESQRVNGHGIPALLRSFCGTFGNPCEQQADYQLLLTQVNLSRPGVWVGVFINTGFVAKFAIPTITLCASLLTFTLRHFGLDIENVFSGSATTTSTIVPTTITSTITTS